MSRISSSPKSPNHLYKRGQYWYWQVFHSSAGLASGRNSSRRAAIREAKFALAELLT